MKIGSLFSGYGGLDLGVQAVLGGDVAWHVEYDKAPSRILDHHWPDVPNYGDVTALDFTSVEPVDILTGGYPCQPFSHAGKRKGTDDDRHLWPHVLRAIRDLGPRLVILENVRGHLTLGFDTVLADLADLGWSAEWGLVRASDAGAPHQRARLFIVAYPDQSGLPLSKFQPRSEEPGQRGHASIGALAAGQDRDTSTNPSGQRHGPGEDPRGLGRLDGQDAGGPRQRQRTRQVAGDRGTTAWGNYATAVRRWERIIGRPAPLPAIERRLNPVFVEWMMGLPAGHVTDPSIGISRNDQLKALGNGVVPQQAALALSLLLPRIGEVAA